MFWKETDSTDIRSVEAVHGGDGVIRMHQFFEGKSSVGANFHVWELDPGASEGNHIHEDDHNYEETYYFLSGEGVMWIDGEDLPVSAGDAVLVPPGVDHGFRNTGSGLLRLVLLYGKPRD